MKPVVTAPVGAELLLATNPTWLNPDPGVIYSSEPSMSAELSEVIVQGTAEFVVSAVTVIFEATCANVGVLYPTYANPIAKVRGVLQNLVFTHRPRKIRLYR
jgi:hypothetical protein